ncbi:restriction endonuclease [Promicromonospora sp. NPDC057138]|uniref:restriction endonuclease n=1 Tax=Promicromonospora sp. NPDC057138 TaxID=3346031 RepID=UPI0036312720
MGKLRDNPPTWRLFEQGVAELIQDLGSGARVEHDARLLGDLSRTQRQIDVLVTGTLAEYPVAIAIECKHLKESVMIDVVEAFIGKLQDINVGTGVIFSTSGFTRPAAQRAEGSRFPKIHLRTVSREMFLTQRRVTMAGAWNLSQRFKMERVGPGRTLLVLENPVSFDATRDVLLGNPGSIGFVGYGSGGLFPAMVRSIEDSLVERISYFGDLDVEGLRVPIEADRVAREAGLPRVQPATDLYEALLERGRPQGSRDLVTREEAEALTNWLDPAHRATVIDLLQSGQQLWQEAVDTEFLRSNAEWSSRSSGTL